MKQPEKILVPLDLSARSRVGVAYAAMMATAFDATLLLMTNVNMPELAVVQDYSATSGVVIDEASDALLREIASEFAPGAKIETVFAFRDFPADGILAVAEEQAADLIVLASHGRSGMSRWLLGSVAEKVSRAAGVAVTIVPSLDQ